MVAVAIGTAAVVGAGASIIGGDKAASATEHAADTANATSLQMYNQTRSDQAPYRAAGSTALSSLMGAYGLTPQSATDGTGSGASSGNGSAYGGFFQSPGYQFEMQQGLKGINQGQAAKGLFGSGATQKADMGYASGLAAQNFGQYTGGLTNIASMGEGATQATGQAGQTTANVIAGNTMTAGNAAANAYANTASSVNSGINNVMSAYLMRNMFSGGGAGGGTSVGWSDRRLKKDIQLVRRDPDGLGWYNWTWKANGEKAHGVIADEVQKLRPRAFVPNYRGSGYDGVNYAQLGSAV
jgi:hypothetical protein